MKALLLSFCFGLIAALQAQAFPASEEHQDVSEKWYLKATASDYNEINVEEMESLSVSPLTIKTLEDGSLQVNFTALIAGQCQEMHGILEKTDEPGKYTAYRDDFVVRVVKSPVEGDYILYCERGAEMQFQTAELVGRDPDINQEALKDFKNVAEARGLDAGNIIIPKQIETCSPESN